MSLDDNWNLPPISLKHKKDKVPLEHINFFELLYFWILLEH